MDSNIVITVTLILALLVIAGLLRYRKSGETEFSVGNWLKFRLKGDNQQGEGISEAQNNSSITHTGANSTNIIAQQVEHLEIHSTVSLDSPQVSLKNLTEKQKKALLSLAQLGQEWRENFYIEWHDSGEISDILDYDGNPPQIAKGDILALEHEKLIICRWGNEYKAYITIIQKSYETASLLTTEIALKILPTARTKDSSPHIEVVVVNESKKTIFCKVKCHAVYNAAGENIKRDISDFANHFSWSGGSEQGVKEIPAGLDGTINLAKINHGGYGMSFLFDENPQSYWKLGGTYKIDMEIAGKIEKDTSRVDFDGKRVIIEFEYKQNESQDSYGGVINNGELRLLSYNSVGS